MCEFSASISHAKQLRFSFYCSHTSLTRTVGENTCRSVSAIVIVIVVVIVIAVHNDDDDDNNNSNNNNNKTTTMISVNNNNDDYIALRGLP